MLSYTWKRKRRVIINASFKAFMLWRAFRAISEHTKCYLFGKYTSYYYIVLSDLLFLPCEEKLINQNVKSLITSWMENVRLRKNLMPSYLTYILDIVLLCFRLHNLLICLQSQAIKLLCVDTTPSSFVLLLITRDLHCVLTSYRILTFSRGEPYTHHWPYKEVNTNEVLQIKWHSSRRDRWYSV